jgi:sec-independent protein translocase protein TatA
MKMSLTEILFVAAVVLIIMSASRMSAIGNALGKFVYSFKKASKGDGFIDAKVVSRTGSARQIEDAQIVDEKKPHS